MLDTELLHSGEVEKAAETFHRDGFVAIKDPLYPEQLQAIQVAAANVIASQTARTPPEEANRGFARYSFGDQLHHWQWRLLIDLQTILPIIDRIWDSQDYTCSGGGGDYSLPGAQIQPLHSDMGDFFNDPLGQCTYRDCPAPFIVVNFMMVDFTAVNGAIRFIPGTQRSHDPIPTLEEESDAMKQSILCAPAGTAVIRDVRCWHGGTANESEEVRPMTSIGYYAPWYRAREANVIPRDGYGSLSRRAQALCTLLKVRF